MTFWDGNRWVAEDTPPTQPTRAGYRRRLLGAGTEAALITLLLFGLIASTALAARGGRGANQVSGPTTCVIDGNVVTAAGLPTDQVINFMVTDARGTWGWALGFAGDEAWGVSVPDRTGPTTYEFASRTWGQGGSHYTVFSSCSASS